MRVFACAYQRKKLRGDVFGSRLLQMRSVNVKNLFDAIKLRSRLHDGRCAVSNDHDVDVVSELLRGRHRMGRGAL